MGALGDFFRFWWELLALNTRKSLARARGLPPPCQTPSDSGRARETGCEACLGWNRTERLRRVCPFLTQTPAGWRCGADAAAVTAFWGRAAAAYLALTVGLFLFATLGVFGGLRAVGFPVRYVDVAWPPAWRRIDLARSDFYEAKGQAALAAGRINEAGLALGLAWDLNPRNADIGFTLARLWQSGQPALSDRVYQRLLGSHPPQAAEIAGSWGHALLLRGDFAGLAKLAQARLSAEAAPSPAWLHALVFSCRRLRDPAPLRAMRDQTQLAPELKTLLDLEAAELAGDFAAVQATLLTPPGENATEYARLHLIGFLIGRGEARTALELLARSGGRLAPGTQVALTLRALGALGTEAAQARLHQEFAALLAHQTEPALYELLAAELVRSPDSARLRLVTDALANRPWATTPAGAPAVAALLCAAVIAEDRAVADQLRSQLRQSTGGRLLVIDRAEELLGARRTTRTAGTLLAQLPILPRETAYAVHERADTP
jgi:hypothetical protein